MQITTNKPYKVIISSNDEYYALEEQHFGMCLNCGEESYSCEPDASGYVCDACGLRTVEGLANLLMMNRVTYD